MLAFRSLGASLERARRNSNRTNRRKERAPNVAWLIKTDSPEGCGIAPRSIFPSPLWAHPRTVSLFCARKFRTCHSRICEKSTVWHHCVNCPFSAIPGLLVRNILGSAINGTLAHYGGTRLRRIHLKRLHFDRAVELTAME